MALKTKGSFNVKMARLLCVAVGLAACFGCHPPAAPVMSQEDKQNTSVANVRQVWTDRLIPLPKEVEITGTLPVCPGAIALTPGNVKAPAVQTAIDLLASFAKASNQNASVKISLGLLEAQPLSSALKKRLKSLPNREQAYAIVTSKKSGNRADIVLAANAPVGLLYAARTLTQLMALPRRVSPDTPIEVPLAIIVDWPDMEERGIWGCGASDIMPWLSQWKLNLTEQLVAADVDAEGQPIIKTNERFNEQKLKEAAALGVHYIPAIGHLGQYGQASSFGKALYMKEWQRLLPLLAMPDSSKPKPLLPDGLCMSNPATKKLIYNWLMLIAGKIEKHNLRDLEVWLSEGRWYNCCCAACAGKDNYELETRAILEAFRTVQKTYPEMRLRIWLSQGSYKSNAKVIALLPADVGATYYDGGRTYCSDRNPMIYPLLADYAANGGFLGVAPQLNPSWFATVPWTASTFIHFRCNEFAGKKLRSLSGYTVPTPTLYEFNVLAMAEWTWNANGRTPQEFARAYAAVNGIHDPAIFAQWAVKAGDAGWALAESRFMESLAFDPTRGISNVADPFDNRFEKTAIRDPGNLNAAIVEAREALALAQAANNPLMLSESEFTLGGLQAFGLMRSIDRSLRNPEALDEKTKAGLAEQINQLDRCASAIREGLYLWNKQMRGQRWTWRQAGIYERIRQPANALLISCDLIRQKSVKLGIPDPRPESRAVKVGGWTPRDFSGGKAVLTLEVTEQLRGKLGDYYVFMHLSECPYTVSVEHVSLFSRDPSGQRVLLVESQDVGENVSQIGSAQRNLHCRIHMPRVSPDLRLVLEIHLSVRHPEPGRFPGDVPEKERICAGDVSLCRLYRPEEIPCSKIAAFKENPLTEPVVRIPLKPGIKVGIAGGVGTIPLISALNKQPDMNAFLLPAITSKNLAQCDVVIVTQGALNETEQTVGEALVRRVRDGAGALFLHDAVGYRMHEPLFKDVGIGTNNPKLHGLIVAAKHPATGSLKGRAFSPGFRYDHIAMEAGSAGQVLVENEMRAPVMIAGSTGKGRVILCGMNTGRVGSDDDSVGSDAEPDGEERQLLVNSVRWLAGK